MCATGSFLLHSPGQAVYINTGTTNMTAITQEYLQFRVSVRVMVSLIALRSSRDFENEVKQEEIAKNRIGRKIIRLMDTK